jgi:hypothetical protein
MADAFTKVGTGARYALAAVRGVNGVATLFAPKWFARRAGLDPDKNPAAIYVLRLFGVRTIYLAGELLLKRGPHLDDALIVAPVVHASDALSAAAAGRAGLLGARQARTGTIISSFNFAFAVLAFLTRPRSGGR